MKGKNGKKEGGRGRGRGRRENRRSRACKLGAHKLVRVSICRDTRVFLVDYGRPWTYIHQTLILALS